MLKNRWIPLVMLTLIVVVSCSILYTVLQSQSGSRETLFQVAAFEPFADGEYAGITTFGELAKHGDFGLGTLVGLDGEMVAINGVFYQVPISGVPRQTASTEETPFALVTFFEADQTLHVADPLNYSELKTYIDQNISPEKAMYAIKVHGTYDYAKVRSVPKQTEPYPILTAVIENQVVFPLNDVTGTIAGFRLPSYMSEINVVGYHCHFITDDETAGGHVLDCIIRDATIEIDYTYEYELVLPENP
jgi:acetolactate decarboxylase